MKIFLNKLFLFSLYLILPIDFITGSILIEDNSATPLIGKLFKFFLLSLILFNILRISNIVFFSLISLFFSTIFSSLDVNIVEWPLNFVSVSKIILFIMIFYQLYYLYKIKILNYDYILKLTIFCTCYICINQILGLSGFGKSTYNFGDLSIGTSGYFFETNSFGFVLVIIQSILSLIIIRKYKIKVFFICSLAFILLGFSISTKLAMIGTLIVPLIILFIHRNIFFYILIFFSIPIFFFQYEKVVNLNQIDKIISSADNTTLQNSIFSGRDERFQKSFNDYFYKYSLVQKTVGISYSKVINDNILSETSEMDFMDILKISGFFGFFLVYGSFTFICFQLYQLYRKYKILEFKTVLIINVFLILASTLGGHLFTSGTPSIFLAILNIYPYTLINYSLNQTIT